MEALDEFGVWAKGKVVAIEQEMFSISFDGFGSMWDHWVSTEDIRRETTSQLPTKRSRQPTTVSFLHAILSILIVFFYFIGYFLPHYQSRLSERYSSDNTKPYRK